MKKTIQAGGLLCIGLVVASIASQNALAGAGGAGNTGDLSIQFSFAKSTAVSILQNVPVSSLYEASGRQQVAHFYESCRKQMYLGALHTRFELVDSIEDGRPDYHALAQRLPGGTIRISRAEMEKLAEARELTAPLLTAVVLHEVGHDCTAPGVTAGDEADELLNDLAESLLRASSARSLAQLLDVTFVERVASGENVRWVDLSARVRAEIAGRYADYVGDWIYLKNRAMFAERPAPASQFFASEATSLFPGWGSSLPLTAGGQLRAVVDQLLSATYRTKDLSYFAGSETRPLPTSLSCATAGDAARCTVGILWNAAGVNASAEAAFRIDLFGDLKIERIRVVEQ